MLSAATAVPQNAFRTSELVGSLMHKLSPELINTISALGVDQRYSTLENYPEFLCGKPSSEALCAVSSVAPRCATGA